MSRFRLTVVLAFLGLALVPGRLSFVYADDIDAVNVTIDRDTIGLDEQAILQVEVTGTSQNIPTPKLPALPMFEIYSQGRSSNISIVNGAVSSSVTYRYMLMPSKAGTFPIKGVAVVYNNHRYEGNPIEITVLNTGSAPSPALDQMPSDTTSGRTGKNRDYYMEAVVDKKNPFVNEQVTLTLKIYLGVQTYGSPELSEPSTTGFWNELLGNKAPYYQKIGGRNYKVIERKYALFPTQTGSLTIGRAILTATVATQSQRRDPFDMFGMFGGGQEVKMRTKPIDIEVKPLPTQGRPKDFTGTIGRFTITATPSRREVEVNQPVSVTFKINGVGNVKSVAEPVIEETDDYRVYRASSNENITKLNDRIGGTKIFEEVFIPKRPGEMEIPGISFTYFDPDAQRYKSEATNPIHLQVSKPEGYVAGQDVPFSGPGMTIGSKSRDIRYVKSDIGTLHKTGSLILSSPLYVAVNTAPILLLAGLVVVRVRRERLQSDIGYARARSASRIARKRLARARSLASGSEVEKFYGELSLAVVSYLADKMNISPHGLTSDAVAGLLQEKGATDDLVDDILAFLRECDFARFAPGQRGTDEKLAALKKGEEIMVKIEGVKFG